MQIINSGHHAFFMKKCERDSRNAHFTCGVHSSCHLTTGFPSSNVMGSQM